MALDESLVAEIESAAEATKVTDPTTMDNLVEPDKEIDKEAERVAEVLEGKTLTAEDGEGKEDAPSGDDDAARTRDAASEGTEAQGDELGDDSGVGTPADKAKDEQGISDYCLQKAVLAGVPLDDAKAFPSEESLLGVVAALETQRDEIVAMQEAAAAAEQAAASKDELEKDPFDELTDLDPDEHDEATIKAFAAVKQLIKSQRDEIDGLKAGQDSAAARAGHANEMEVTQWFDKEVSDLGEGFEEALGKGTRASLNPGSSQLAKRDDIAHQISIMLGGYQAQGIAVPPREQLFRNAARIVLADEFSQNKTVGLSEKLKKRASQHINRATGRTQENQQSPEEEAAAMIDKKWPRN